MVSAPAIFRCGCTVSVLFNEPKLLKCFRNNRQRLVVDVSVLFNEPKLLKLSQFARLRGGDSSFSALQRAEIAEINRIVPRLSDARGVSVLFNEPKLLKCWGATRADVSAGVSVLFNEPKLLKS